MQKFKVLWLLWLGVEVLLDVVEKTAQIIAHGEMEWSKRFKVGVEARTLT
jgi:hypothetical protein